MDAKLVNGTSANDIVCGLVRGDDHKGPLPECAPVHTQKGRRAQVTEAVTLRGCIQSAIMMSLDWAYSAAAL
jgi:hypothetical protein